MGMAEPRLFADPEMEAERLEPGKQDWQRHINPSTPCLPFKVALDREDVARYRQLKVMAQEAGDHEKDGEFFAYEMMAKRGVETASFAGLLFNTLYWRLSDYGQSFTKPLKWMGVSFGFFLFLYAFALARILPLAERMQGNDIVWLSGELSFRNSVPLIGTAFRFAISPEGQQTWFEKNYERFAKAAGTFEPLHWLSMSQSLIGAILLFLLLLGLRNRFRLK